MKPINLLSQPQRYHQAQSDLRVPRHPTQHAAAADHTCNNRKVILNPTMILNIIVRRPQNPRFLPEPLHHFPFCVCIPIIKPTATAPIPPHHNCCHAFKSSSVPQFNEGVVGQLGPVAVPQVSQVPLLRGRRRVLSRIRLGMVAEANRAIDTGAERLVDAGREDFDFGKKAGAARGARDDDGDVDSNNAVGWIGVRTGRHKLG